MFIEAWNRKCWREVQEAFRQELERQMKAVKYNYRTPTPQYYQNKIQLLLPLYNKDKKVVLVATLDRCKNGGKEYYHISTVLDPSWAYNNARVICPIESNWLISALEKQEAFDDTASVA